jgi:hypothetical protein
MRITIELSGAAQPRLAVDGSELPGEAGQAASQGSTGSGPGSGPGSGIEDAMDGGSPDPDLLQALGGQMPPAGQSVPAGGSGAGLPPADDGGGAPSWLAGVIEGSLGQPIA